MDAEQFTGPRPFPTSADEMASAHKSWGYAVWEDAGFPAAGSVHIVALKPVLARVLQEGGE
eukprot:3086544-Prymnesium_polylepis.1